MPLETGTYVSDLVETNPPGTDLASQGDDHLRLVKSVLKVTFAGIVGLFKPIQDTNGGLSNFGSTIRTVTGNITLVASDNGKVLRMTNASAAVVTLPSGTTLVEGFSGTVIRSGAGTVTFAVGGSDTFEGLGTAIADVKGAAQFIHLTSATSGVWGAYGDLA